MSEESFRSGEETGAIGYLLETNEPLTAFFTIEAMDYYSKPCELKFVWKSPEKAISSFAFPKGSPLLPFFKHAYSKIGQSGALERISRKWMKKGIPLNCNSKNSIEPLTLNKIGSLIVLLFMGMIFAFVAFIIEVCMDQMQATKKCKETTAIIELRESFLDKPLQKFHPFSLTDGGFFKACQRQLMKGSAASDNNSIVELNQSKTRSIKFGHTKGQ